MTGKYLLLHLLHGLLHSVACKARPTLRAKNFWPWNGFDGNLAFGLIVKQEKHRPMIQNYILVTFRWAAGWDIL